ncbi:hypothetical protein NAEGRDRAFT_81920 [Naegleria gruberi]|uniref:Uncharacterized protein n=1 Tax=Naegleria gruberi TaxID=5762 RepID=D2W0E2_NAEGR|nr:uncharacterized protein NAEGRDRAFT_81920 [Naegleria gruberi]EFC37417.1 hypothetical protein NAEGRDRAFT_81920 [Naegleria gruberi]|eukprot:XP_002670161.1 hypothetical protein NAEGRDRAFT_81920 [Naegleria gruberi strain NEG-M]
MSKTTVTLIDFVPSSSIPNHELLNFLKYSLRAKQYKKFSMNFNLIGKLKGTKGEYMYDLGLSDCFNKIIVGNQHYLEVFERGGAEYYRNQPSDFSPLFSVSYEHHGEFHCLRVVNENGHEFIYATTNKGLIKIRVQDLMNNKSKVEWVFKKNSYCNIWGLDVIGTRVYYLDFNNSSLFSLNRNTGTEVEEEKLKDLTMGYGLQFLSENKILTSHGNCLEILEKKENQWVSLKKGTSLETSCLYSMFYEKESGLIYTSNTTEGHVVIADLEHLSLVKKCENSLFNWNYGIIVDSKTGLLYICNRTTNHILIFE